MKIESQRQKIVAMSFNRNRYKRNNFCAFSLTSVRLTITRKTFIFSRCYPVFAERRKKISLRCNEEDGGKSK
ncbi:MAG TPA: hypothetical protein DHU79_04700 [Clostridiales bacterium]|nr:hypothetical protein [Clostridiales bacterium]